MGSDAKLSMFDQFALVGKALGSGKRLELLDLIAQRERTVGELAQLAGLGISTTSAHLQVLKRARLVTTRREETSIFYALAGDDVAALYVQVQRVARSHIAEAERARLAYLGVSDDSDVVKVDREELLARVRSGSVVVLDVRPGDEYAAGHIPGAASIPLEQLERRLAELPADLEVVAYCRGDNCVMALEAVRLLRANGRNAHRLDHGIVEWRVSGQPISPAPHPAG
ncbi:ArsR/SmtB family transcription factor [Amycolatopsis keratiniphila]|uniref:ArsR/SmtB family transcription factor n=1 Tax=Amycolatopsis keratiniphila TaxID=129921 RepID=UPI00087A5551|nr:metalloregulator ArsR/SmtB family transcription factor [Amycolatopsis keratiniphila]OLZ50159.1 ArsR family transcriptional regulator [Amycolatopsis keratiniphila subsp. nogabecina]SDU66558.1 Rhodanese-related sulfurtransferase [Amycolatopsis keratiniphila]